MSIIRLQYRKIKTTKEMFFGYNLKDQKLFSNLHRSCLPCFDIINRSKTKGEIYVHANLISEFLKQL